MNRGTLALILAALALGAAVLGWSLRNARQAIVTTTEDTNGEQKPFNSPGGGRNLPDSEGVGGETQITSRITSVTFPDGDSVEIRLRPRPSIAFGPLPESIEEEYESLKARAESGDGEAAYVLAAAIKGCEHNFWDKEALESTISRMKQTGQLYWPNFDYTEKIKTTDYARQEAMLRRRFTMCEGVTENRMAEYKDWLRMASDLSFDRGMDQYATLYAERDEAIQIQERWWRQGETMGALALHELYKTESSDGSVDKVKAFAYLYVYVAVAEAEYSEINSSEEVQEMMKYLRELLQSESRLMYPQEMEEALTNAKDILRRTRKCCYRVLSAGES